MIEFMAEQRYLAKDLVQGPKQCYRTIEFGLFSSTAERDPHIVSCLGRQNLKATTGCIVLMSFLGCRKIKPIITSGQCNLIHKFSRPSISWSGLEIISTVRLIICTRRNLLP